MEVGGCDMMRYDTACLRSDAQAVVLAVTCSKGKASSPAQGERLVLYYIDSLRQSVVEVLRQCLSLPRDDLGAECGLCLGYLRVI